MRKLAKDLDAGAITTTLLNITPCSERKLRRSRPWSRRLLPVVISMNSRLTQLSTIFAPTPDPPTGGAESGCGSN
jgi:hypothetical protein